jgi:hypothetical protein
MQTTNDSPKEDDKGPAMSKDVEVQHNHTFDGDSLNKHESEIAGQVEDLDEANVFLRQHNITPEYIAELLEDEAANKRVLRNRSCVARTSFNSSTSKPSATRPYSTYSKQPALPARSTRG